MWRICIYIQWPLLNRDRVLYALKTRISVIAFLRNAKYHSSIRDLIKSLYIYSACFSRHFGKKVTIKKPLPNTRLTLYKICWFSLQCTDSFPESGSKKHFQGSGMRAIDSPHKITPRGLLVKKIWRKIFFGDRAANGTPLNCCCDIEFTNFFHFSWFFSQKFANDLN